MGICRYSPFFCRNNFNKVDLPELRHWWQITLPGLIGRMESLTNCLGCLIGPVCADE